MKLSVIITLYQAQSTLIRCIVSVERALEKLTSRYKFDTEIILVNDGSTDDTHNVCKALIKKYKNILYIQQECNGKSDARNEALMIATGDYICFVEQQDEVDEKLFISLYGQMKSDTSLVASRVYNILDIQKKKRVSIKDKMEVIGNSESAIEKMALNFENITILGMLFRKSNIIHYFQADKEPLSEACFIVDYLSEASGIVKIINDSKYYKYYYQNNDITIESIIGIKRAYFYISDIMHESGCKGKEALLLKYLDCYARFFQQMSIEDQKSPVARELWYKFREEGKNIKKNMRMSLLESIYFTTVINSLKLNTDLK